MSEVRPGADTSRAPASQTPQPVPVPDDVAQMIGGLITVNIDGQDVKVPMGTTILEAAKKDRGAHPDPVPPPRPLRGRRVPRLRRRGGGAAHAAGRVRLSR